MNQRVLQLLLLVICSLQLVLLPARETISIGSHTASDSVLLESAEGESCEENCYYVAHLVSLDCQHDQIVGEVYLPNIHSQTVTLSLQSHLRGPPVQNLC